MTLPPSPHTLCAQQIMNGIPENKVVKSFLESPQDEQVLSKLRALVDARPRSPILSELLTEVVQAANLSPKHLNTLLICGFVGHLLEVALDEVTYQFGDILDAGDGDDRDISVVVSVEHDFL